MHVRASTRRLQPRSINTIENGDNNQRPRISRRDISVLQQMMIAFFIFIVGWTPIYFSLVLSHYIMFDPLIIRYGTIVGGLAVLATIINLFLYNHEIKEYLINKIRQCVRL
jgi:hypothetical protein